MDLIVDMTQRGKITISLLFFFYSTLYTIPLNWSLFFLYGLLFRFRGEISGGWGVGRG